MIALFCLIVNVKIDTKRKGFDARRIDVRSDVLRLRLLRENNRNAELLRRKFWYEQQRRQENQE